MNSMHNSFGGSAPGGYGSPYPGYVPPTALPYYNGYPPDLSQGPSSYYGKPTLPGYSAGMSSYPSAAGINNSMYYQQYGLGYQYGYSKYGLSPGIPSGLGYGGDIGNPGNITPSTLGGMQAPSNDLGLTGSMFSKGSSSSVAQTTASSSIPSTVTVTSISNCSNSKYSSASSNSPHPTSSSQPNMMPSLAPSAPSSPNIHSQSSAIHGGIATSSPPVDSGDAKKDLDKMKRCQICGQVFRLMSECLAHMKAAHETLMPMYNIPGHGSHNNQSMLSHHVPPQTPARPTSNAPDSPLMALERMGWGKEQSMTPGIHSAAQHSAGYPPHVPQMPPHLPDARYGEPSPHSAKRLNDYYNSCSSSSSPMNQESGYSMERQSPSVLHSSGPINARPRKSSSYSVSSIIGESNDSRTDQASTQEKDSNQSSGLPPCLTPNLPVTSMSSLPPNLSPNPPSGLHHSSTGPPLAQQPPQLTPNLPNSVSTSQLPELSPHCHSESEQTHDRNSLEKQLTPETDTKSTESFVEKNNENVSIVSSNENVNALSNESKCKQDSEIHHSNDIQHNEDQKKHSPPNEMPESVSSSGFEDGQVNKLQTDNEEDISSSDAVNKVDSAVSNDEETVCDVSKSNTEESAPNQEEEIGDEDEPGDPSHPLHDQTPPSQSPSQTQVWTNLPSSTPPNTSSPKAISLPTPPQSVQEQSPQPQPSPHPPPTPTPQSDTPSPSIHSQSFYPHPKNRMSPMSPHEFNDKQMHQHNTPMKNNPQQTPYQGAWPQGYIPSGASPAGYQYHQYPMHPSQSMGSNSNKMHGVYPPSRYPNQYPGYDSRRQMHSSYGPGHWYPPGRSDSKPPWVSWGSHQGHPYSHQYYYGNSGGPPHMPQHSPMGHKYPTSHPVQAPSVPPQLSSPSLASPVKSTPDEIPSQIQVDDKVKEIDTKPIRKGDRQKAKRGRAGPKSRTERKIPPVPKVDSVTPPDVDKEISQDFDSSIYALTPMHQNGNLSSVTVSPGDANSNMLDSDTLENDENDQPKLAILKPAKKRKSTDGSFIGPKRIKIAKKVRQRQQCRQKLLQDQIKQSELEEQLTQQWVERAAEEEGPLANVLLKSSLLLGDNNVQEQDIMEDSIASITAELFQSSSNEELDGSGYNQCIASTSPNSAGGKKPGRKAGMSKVLHNSKSVVVKSKGKIKNTPPKLRAKDFKWSHYIKTMRFWCKDCGHGFKNQKDSQSHSEEQCKWNCLYLLECYVSVKDIVQHKTYGEKVEELLEEYQVDAEHKCNKCGAIVSRKADFLVHVDTHKDFMPWECTICGTRFKIRGSLKEHLRYTHMKGRVPCLKCNKVFATSTQLRQHVKVHTQHYKYTRVGKNREEDLRVAREAEEHEEAPPPVSEAEEHISSDQLSHEANEYRNWCKLMELNAMKNIATNDSGKNEDEEEDDMMESEGEES